MTDLDGLIKLLNSMADDREGKIHLSPNDISDITKELSVLNEYHQGVHNGDILIIDLAHKKLFFSKENKLGEVLSYKKEMDGSIVIEVKPIR